MISVFELGYRYLLPSIKRRLTEKLSILGLNQAEIAGKLKLSPSTVSRYLSKERGHLVNLAEIAEVDKAIETLALHLKNQDVDPYTIQLETCKIAIYTLSNRHLCRYHAEIDPEIEPAKCRLCTTLFHLENL